MTLEYCETPKLTTQAQVPQFCETLSAQVEIKERRKDNALVVLCIPGASAMNSSTQNS